MNKVIILANGEFPKTEIPLKILENNEFLICCDGAINNLLETNIEPDLIIGDLDSINEELKIKYFDKIIKIDEQNTNDLTKAINWCVKNKVEEVEIIGATGKREDHTIANISLLVKYVELIKVKIITDYGVFTPITKTTKFHSFKGQQVSIFALDNKLKINSENLKYPLQDLQLKSWWMGTLNEVTDDEFTISFKNKGQIIVYQANK